MTHIFACYQCINSIDRALLNEGLLEEASSLPNIHIFFNHKIQSVDFDGRQMVVRDLTTQKDVQVPFGFCIGADGSYSVIRRQMMRVVRSVVLPPHFSGCVNLNAF